MAALYARSRARLPRPPPGVRRLRRASNGLASDYGACVHRSGCRLASTGHRGRARGRCFPALQSPGGARLHSALDLAGLAGTLHAVLAQHGDHARSVDAIYQQYETRMRGVRDLIPAFEGLYPLLWRYYEEFGRGRALARCAWPRAALGKSLARGRAAALDSPGPKQPGAGRVAHRFVLGSQACP